MDVVMAYSSSNRTEVAFVFPVSGTMRGARVVSHVVFESSLTTQVCLLMSGGEGRSSVDLSLLGPPLLRCLVESLC